MNEDKGASWVSDARRLLQDFVAPELRAITARFDASDLRQADRDRREAERDNLAAERHQALIDKIEAVRREIMLQVELAITKNKLEQLQMFRNQSAQAPQEQ